MTRIALVVLAMCSLAPTMVAQHFVSTHRAFPLLEEAAEQSVLADLDGDGSLDMLVGTINRERLLLNDGRARFRDATAALPQLTGSNQQGLAVALADLDGDGDVDAFVGGSFGPHWVFLNDGTGSFVRISVASMPMHAALLRALTGDLDGDGDLDVIAGGSQYCHVFLNDGSGGLTETLRVTNNSFTISGLALADFDGDGDLDAVATRVGGGGMLLTNYGSGRILVTLGRAPDLERNNHGGVAAGDLDGDGDVDLIVTNSTPSGSPSFGFDDVLLNAGNGTFQRRPGALPALAHESGQVALLDVDGDRDLDVLLATRLGAELRLNDGAGWFVDASGQLPADTTYAVGIAIGDIDGDGDSDAVLSRQRVRHALLLNDGSGRFVDVAFPDLPPLLSGPGSRPALQSMVLDDLDGDGVPDLAVIDPILGVRSAVYRNDGDGRFAELAASGLPAQAVSLSAIAAGDVDRDGDLDVVTADGSGRMYLYQNLGGARFIDVSAGRMPTPENVVREIRFVDVDADGDNDLVCAPIARTGSLMINDGTGAFTIQTAARLPGASIVPLASPHVAVGDLDQDGDPDIVFGGNPPPIYLNDGFGYFVRHAFLTISPSIVAYSMDLGDADGDGDLDVLIGGAPGSRLLLNDGTASFADVSVARLGPVPPRADSRASWVDVDGDGDLDALFDSSVLLENDGRGWFVDRSSELPVVPTRLPHALADVDGDGDVDVVADARDVWRNTTRHLAWRRLPRIGRSLELDLYAARGQVWLTWASTGRARLPLPFGTFRLDPGQIVFAQGGAFDALGHGSLTLPVPNDRNLVGFQLHWQALLLPGTALTNVETVAFLGL